VIFRFRDQKNYTKTAGCVFSQVALYIDFETNPFLSSVLLTWEIFGEIRLNSVLPSVSYF